MKVIKHEGVPRPTTMTLQTDPLVVWLSKTLEVQIERGDTLKEVALLVRKHWKADPRSARRIAAFWFAVGERQNRQTHVGDFTKRELSRREDRRYLMR